MRIGLIINPIAGMGGRVGLKGTDGKETLEEAKRRGAKPKAQDRACIALVALKDSNIEWFTWGGTMGEYVLRTLGYAPTILGSPWSDETSKEDTLKAVKAMQGSNLDLIIFTGGDGTAVDVMSIIGTEVPILGIPSGVKMYSGVFTTTPRAAGELLRRFVSGEASVAEREVMDIDEEAYREGYLSAELKGYARTPFIASLVMNEKSAVHTVDEDLIKESIADRVVEEMKEDALYIIGPGSTTASVLAVLGLEKTILGVDLVRNKELVAKDVDEQGILAEMRAENYIVLSPLGGMGSILGRGNQQISPEVVKRTGKKQIIIVSTPTKLAQTETLVVDTGDSELDDELRGFMRVIISRHETKLAKIV
jgi:predicted polyphosphate/ATP-dependent NAD kinase